MSSSTGSGSSGGPAPRRSGPSGSSRSREPSADSARHPIEPRLDLAVPLPVRLRRRGGEEVVEYAVNLSPGGLGLHLARPLDDGETVELALELPGDEAPLRARGRVVWSEGGTGSSGRFLETGIRFEGVTESDRQRLLAFVAAGRAGGAGSG